MGLKEEVQAEPKGRAGTQEPLIVSLFRVASPEDISDIKDLLLDPDTNLKVLARKVEERYGFKVGSATWRRYSTAVREGSPPWEN